MNMAGTSTFLAPTPTSQHDLSISGFYYLLSDDGRRENLSALAPGDSHI